MGFVAACFPAYRPLVKQLFSRKDSSSGHSSGYPLQPRKSDYKREQSDASKSVTSQVESKGQQPVPFTERNVEGGYLKIGDT